MHTYNINTDTRTHARAHAPTHAHAQTDREREREREREVVENRGKATETRDRQTDRQIDRQTDRQTERETERDTHTEREREREREREVMGTKGVGRLATGAVQNRWDSVACTLHAIAIVNSHVEWLVLVSRTLLASVSRSGTTLHVDLGEGQVSDYYTITVSNALQ